MQDRIIETTLSVCKPATCFGLQPKQLFIRFACLSPREFKCSEWWNRHFINNWTLFILFMLVPQLLEFTDVLDVWTRL